MYFVFSAFASSPVSLLVTTEAFFGFGSSQWNKHGRWLDPKPKKETSSYAINVDPKAVLLTIANKHTTHPLAVATRLKTIELRNSTSISFHWVKGHGGLKGNERDGRLLGQNSCEL